jgi:hypothetical protein
MDFFTDLLATASGKIGFAALLVPLLGLIIKKVPMQRLKKWLYEASYSIGRLVTTRGNRSWWGSIYSSTIEPWLIVVFRDTLGAISKGFVDGMESDN